MDVHFDYIYDGKDIVVGVLIKDGKDELDYKTVNLKGMGNPQKYNLDYSLMAFSEAINIVADYGLDEVKFMNQNQYVFDWVINMQFEKRDIIQEIVHKLTLLVKDGVNCTYEIIQSKNNGVKKKLKKDTKVHSKGDFSSLLIKQEEDIVCLNHKNNGEYKKFMAKVTMNRR